MTIFESTFKQLRAAASVDIEEQLKHLRQSERGWAERIMHYKTEFTKLTGQVTKLTGQVAKLEYEARQAREDRFIANKQVKDVQNTMTRLASELHAAKQTTGDQAQQLLSKKRSRR